MADALAISGKAISVPSFVVVDEPLVAFFTMALGSNLPAYGVGKASSSIVIGDLGEAAVDEMVAFLSISSRRLRVPPEASSSFCLRSLSTACFCFQASSLASLSAFLSSSVCPMPVLDVCRPSTRKLRPRRPTVKTDAPQSCLDPLFYLTSCLWRHRPFSPFASN